MLILQSDRIRALTNRGLVAFSREKNLRGLQNELIEMADALAKLIDALEGGNQEAIARAFEEASLEGADCIVMLARYQGVLRNHFGEIEGTLLSDQALDIKLAKAEAKVTEAERAKALEEVA